MEEPFKIVSKEDPGCYISVTKGHFSSDRFHVNYYIDMTTVKNRMSAAQSIAKVMSRKYVNRVNLSHTSSRFSGPYMEAMAEASATVTPIDTIVCLDGCEVIGAYMAEELTGLGVVSNNRHHTFYVVSPEFDREGQMVVRDNIRHMFKDKNVLIILATAMSGHTIYKSIKCINSYGGKVQGISCVFGAVEEIEGYPVNAVFTRDDLPDFELSEPDKCPMCEAGKPLDAVICSYGYSKL
ncbi:MAG: hypothetical protein LKF79_03575 [Solobacterium sp.]|jgi:orotate phosphoribosyltransferase|nr:hypothetical protein [Solobacterium sp.]MCH4222044.1 hypothetical protein [Solobacterium sp.]MCH4265706.1 hypothetical protein [Solobacterium sp.]